MLICQVDRHPFTLTILQVSADGYRELATRSLGLPRDLNQVLAQRIVDAATTDDDPLRGKIAQPGQNHDSRLLLESVRQARHLLAAQDRAPVLLPAPPVITRDDVALAAQPLLEEVHNAVRDILDAADIDSQHVGGVVLRQAEPVPGLQERLTAATGLTPAILTDQSHALRVVGVRTSLPQLGTAGALAMLTAFAVAHLAPTTWLAGTTTTATPEPATGSLIRRGYLTAAVGGAVTAAFYGLATGTAVNFDYSPYLKWTINSAVPLAVCAAIIAATAPRIPAHALPAWLERTRPVVLHAAIATAGIYLMRAALTITAPVDLTGMDGLVGSVGAALVGVATALTTSRSRTIRTITAPGLALGYAIVFTNDTNSALIIGYLVALTWWGIRLTARTLQLAFPTAGAALRRIIDGRDT